MGRRRMYVTMGVELMLFVIAAMIILSAGKREPNLVVGQSVLTAAK